MSDLTDAELRELDMWVAEACGVKLLDRDELRDAWNRPFRPTRSFDQAWEHLRPLLKAKRLDICITDSPDTPIVAHVWSEKDWNIDSLEPADTPALAFCLAAKAALETDDG